MKKIALSLILSVCISFVFAQHQLASSTKPATSLSPDAGAFNWSQTTFDFGKIKVNKPVTHEFTFINNGDAPLIVTSVQASCGCTVTKYSKDPINPGGQGFVTATYNAANVGIFTKTVTVNANTEEGIVQLTIKGEVVK
jgi:hypothetical protein